MVDRLLIAGRVLLSSSSSGKYLRGWSMKDGTLLWEAVTYTAAAPSAEAALENQKDVGVDVLPLGRDADGDGVEDVLVLVRSRTAWCRGPRKRVRKLRMRVEATMLRGLFVLQCCRIIQSSLSAPPPSEAT